MDWEQPYFDQQKSITREKNQLLKNEAAYKCPELL
jgi:hypothetical protein